MRKRTKAREMSLQILYEIDIRKEPLSDLINDFWGRPSISKSADKEIKKFVMQLVEGTIAQSEVIDKTISAIAKNWQLKRMAVIDRNIIRMGAYELLFIEDIPPKVSINEAVELAKRYGDVESSKFVNGILDKIHKESLSTKGK